MSMYGYAYKLPHDEPCQCCGNRMGWYTHQHRVIVGPREEMIRLQIPGGLLVPYDGELPTVPMKVLEAEANQEARRPSRRWSWYGAK